MGKYVVRAVALLRYNKKRVGYPRNELIDTSTNELFKNVRNRKQVRKKYEAFWNDLNPHSEEIVKVLSIKKIN